MRETIGRNLEMAGVAPEWCNLAGSYLYAAYIHHMDLLLAGPHGRAIANALALAVEGKRLYVFPVMGNRMPLLFSS